MAASLTERADILIVDDRLDGLIALEAVLSDPKINIFKAHSGAAALAMMPHHEFAAILLDVQMPVMDGIETASRIRKVEANSHIPIIFVTAINKDERYVTRGYDEGAVDYILKPFNPHILRSKVKIFVDLFLQGKKLRYQEGLLLQAERGERVRQLAALELEALRRYRNLADAIPHIVCRTRPDSTPEYFNQVWVDFTGLSLEASVGEAFQMAIHPDNRQRLMKIWLDALITETSFEAEARFRRMDGFYRWHLVRAVPERGSVGEIVAWIGTATDIDDRKRATESLHRAKEEAESANLAKTQFLANMSHEIRTPLAAILGFSELLLNSIQSPEDEIESISAIRRNGEQLLHLVNEILDISKVEAGKLEIETLKVDLLVLLNEIRLIFELKADQKGLEFTIECENEIPTQIWTDPVRLRQILTNVIGNAIKFTEQGSVRVSLSYTPAIDANLGRLAVLVRDTGVGISAEGVDKLFQPFTQADSSTTRRFGGTGLGLALSKKLAQMLGGDIALLRSESQSTVFEFTINCAADTEDFLPPGQLRPMKLLLAKTEDQHLLPLQNRTILVVDDAPDNRILISRFLNGAGARVELATNGLEGLERASASHYDLILMDIQMPGMDGYVATQTLRRQGLTCPIIALTAHALKSVFDKCMAIGFDDYLAKPMEKQRLLQIVTQWIKARPNPSVLPKTATSFERGSETVSRLSDFAPQCKKRGVLPARRKSGPTEQRRATKQLEMV